MGEASAQNASEHERGKFEGWHRVALGGTGWPRVAQSSTGWHRVGWQDRHFCKIQCSIALCGTCRPDDRTDYHLAAKVDLDLMARGSEESDGGSDRDEVLPPRLGRLLRLLHILTRAWRCHSDKNIEDNKTIGNSRADHTYDAWSRQCDDHKPRVSSNGVV